MKNFNVVQYKKLEILLNSRQVEIWLDVSICELFYKVYINLSTKLKSREQKKTPKNLGQILGLWKLSFELQVGQVSWQKYCVGLDKRSQEKAP